MSFVHLHNHSEFSVLDGLATTKKLAERVKQLDQPAAALTDHGTMLGILDFVDAAHNAGIKPIIGFEAYMAARRMTDKEADLDRKSAHQLLLAENLAGYHNLIHLASEAQINGFYYYPRIDLPLLEKHSEGVITTSGCFGGLIPQALRAGNEERAHELIRWFLERFGDRFYIELQDHNIPGLLEVNKRLVQLARQYQIKLIATNDAHYIDKTDAPLQNVLLAVNTGSRLDDADRFQMEDETYYIRTTDEMKVLFAEVPDAISNTLEIAERCNVDIKRSGYLLPKFPVPGGYTAETYLRHLCTEGLKKRYKVDQLDELRSERLNYELGIIHQMGFDDYFLIVWDLVNEARSRGILYNARGSGAGSITAYGLGITSVCPIEFKLIFERFLNPDRISMPDIDMDFQDDRRAEMMRYTVSRYGDDRVASIMTYGRMQARAAIRGVGRALGVELPTVDKIAKMVPGAPTNPTVREAIETVPDIKNAMADPTVKRLLETAVPLEGRIQSLGTHAAGIVIAPGPLTDFVALHRTTSKDSDVPVKKVVQLDMAGVDKMGLLKVDFLGLSTLTVIQRALALIRQRHGVDMSFGNIPLDDPEAYALLGAGDTTAVFQFESAGMKKYLREMKPHNLENIIAMVALYRPGPMEFIPSYIRRMHGEEEVKYRHPRLAEVFDDTFGIPIYQEQIMFAAVKLGGYTQAQADELRKAISKKQADKIAKHKQKFSHGAVERGIPEVTALEIFTDWENFARYGFNRSHAAVYGAVAVKTAWLKRHYPVEFFAAVLSVFRDDQKKIINYMADCRAHGIQILPPDVNHSDLDFTIEETGKGPAIRFGLTAIKNAGNAVRALIEARGNTPFTTLTEFVQRVDIRALGKKALESLSKAGAFSAFGTRRQMLDAIPEMQKRAKKQQKKKEAQMSFGDMGVKEADAFTLAQTDEYGAEQENLVWEKELIGLYLTGHPIEAISPEIYATHYSDELSSVPAGKEVTLVVLLTQLKKHLTKNGKAMAFAKAEDLHGELEMVIFPNAWQQSGATLREGGIYVVDGKSEGGEEEEGRTAKIIVERIAEFKDGLSRPAPDRRPAAPAPQGAPAGSNDVEERAPRNVVLFVPAGASNDELAAISACAMSASGDDRLAVVLEDGSGCSARIDFTRTVGMNETVRNGLLSICDDMVIAEYDPNGEGDE